MTDTTSPSKIKVYLASFLLTSAALWTIHSCLKQKRLKQLKEQLKAKSDIHAETVIVAFEPEELFVKMHDQPQENLK